MGDKPKRPPTAGHGRRKASQVQEIVQAILAQVRTDFQGQFMSLNQRLGGIEQRQRLDAAQLTLGSYREDVRCVLIELLGHDSQEDEAAIKQAFDIADMMDAEYGTRMAARKALAAAEAEAEAAALSDDAAEGELGPDDVQEILEGIAERREGDKTITLDLTEMPEEPDEGA
jgi:hypothetical protein